MEFSPSPDAYPDIFHPHLELFSRRLAARPWHQFGHFPSNPRVVGFSSRQVATVSDFHQALAPSWTFFAHCLRKLTFSRASQTTCGIFPTDVWYPGTSEKFALTTSGGNDALSPALWKSPQRCVSVRRWVCAVLGPARHSLARVHKLPGNFGPSAAVVQAISNSRRWSSPGAHHILGRCDWCQFADCYCSISKISARGGTAA